MRTLVVGLVFLWMSVSGVVVADEVAEVKIVEPYIELRTGPGSGHPVFHVVDRGEFIDVLKRKTDWFKVRYQMGASRIIEGWVNRAQLELTVAPGGESTRLAKAGLDDFTNRRWEMGVLGGDFNGAPVMAVYGGFAFNKNLSAEISAAKVVGEFSSSTLYLISVLSQPFPEWRYSPFFTLGAGQIETQPRVTLVQAKDTRDLVAHVGLGLKVFLSRRFILRAEYKNYVAFSSDNNNEEFEEWKVGFSFFF
ncbi:MAG: SH3 domain-containing protein [Gammaproteobacteria bacterium]|nr:SH3 domain-containing protein [Gammaproteobacteria bacterium]